MTTDTSHPIADVPSPIDLRQMADARAWTDAAMERRPWRAEFFTRFTDEVAALGKAAPRVLELASGPGFLAQQLLLSNDGLQGVLLDFSQAMHELAAERLGPLAQRVQFVLRDMKQPDWTEGLGHFDAIVTHQAVHELRHKRYATPLHAQARSLLAPGGVYLMCDHILGEGGMSNGELYMTVDEQRNALVAAGFSGVELLMCKGGLAMFWASA